MENVLRSLIQHRVTRVHACSVGKSQKGKRETERERERNEREGQYVGQCGKADNNTQHGANSETIHRGRSVSRRDSLNQRSVYNKTARRLEGL